MQQRALRDLPVYTMPESIQGDETLERKDETVRVAIYTRVSTDKQTEASQLDELRRCCELRGWKGAIEIHDQISGSKAQRPGLDSLLEMIRSGKVQTVLCFRLDRLGRSVQQLVSTIAEFTTHRVALVIPSQGIDTSSDNPAAQLQLNILAAIAQFERGIIRERVNAGLKAAVARGVKLGRRPTLHEHAEAVMRLRLEGKGIRETARELGLPVSSVAKARKELV